MNEPSHASGGSSTAVAAGTRIRVMNTWRDGTEMIEEYEKSTGKLAVRKWRKRDALGRSGKWEFEIGEPTVSTAEKTDGKLFMTKSSRNPTFVAQDDSEFWVWRVRNIPYEKSVYQLSVDEERQQIVLRTTNKKYFKRFQIPSLVRSKLKMDPRAVSCKYANCTLMIKYAKPASIRVAEAEWRKKQTESTGRDDAPTEGCKQQ
eukprot:g5465.t1